MGVLYFCSLLLLSIGPGVLYTDLWSSPSSVPQCLETFLNQIHHFCFCRFLLPWINNHNSWFEEHMIPACRDDIMFLRICWSYILLLPLCCSSSSSWSFVIPLWISWSGGFCYINTWAGVNWFCSPCFPFAFLGLLICLAEIFWYPCQMLCQAAWLRN